MINGNRFYAVSQEVFYEQEEPFRCGVQFEIVSADDIEVFLGVSEDIEKLLMDKGTDACQRALEALQQEGLPGEEFGKVKFSYLNETSFGQFVWYLDEVEIPMVPLGQWYCFELWTDSPDARRGMFLQFIDLENYPNTQVYYEEVMAQIMEVQPDIQERLCLLYQLPPMNSTQPKGAVNVGLAPGDTLQDIQILDMDQALCMAIRDNNDDPLVFFDFGVPVNICTINFGQAPEYPDLLHYMQAAQAAQRTVNVVLSHWHGDHMAAAVPLKRYMDHTVWEVPNKGAPSAGVVYNAITQDNSLQNINTHAGAFSGTQLGGHAGFLIGKIDMTGGGAASTNLHHHAMYAQMRSSTGTPIFLSGDVTYSELPAAVRDGMGNTNGYEYLQASHHGGDYHMSPAHQNFTDIPKPEALVSPPADTPMVIYSCGVNNGYKHPDHKGDYRSRGWNYQHRTDKEAGVTVW